MWTSSTQKCGLIEEKLRCGITSIECLRPDSITKYDLESVLNTLYVKCKYDLLDNKTPQVDVLDTECWLI